MKKGMFGKAALGAALSLATLAGGSSLAEARTRLTPQQQLDKLLAGRVAGKPVSCITLTDSNDSQVIDKTAIVYGWGRTLYVNRPTNAQALNDDYVLVTKITGSSQLCRLDTIDLHDRSSHSFMGFAVLNDFVPYTRAGK